MLLRVHSILISLTRPHPRQCFFNDGQRVAYAITSRPEPEEPDQPPGDAVRGRSPAPRAPPMRGRRSARLSARPTAHFLALTRDEQPGLR